MRADARLKAALDFGADLTAGRDDAVAYVQDVTGGRGADVAIEAVGLRARRHPDGLRRLQPAR